MAAKRLFCCYVPRGFTFNRGDETRRNKNVQVRSNHSSMDSGAFKTLIPTQVKNVFNPCIKCLLDKLYGISTTIPGTSCGRNCSNCSFYSSTSFGRYSETGFINSFDEGISPSETRNEITTRPSGVLGKSHQEARERLSYFLHFLDRYKSVDVSLSGVVVLNSVNLLDFQL